MAVKSLIWSRPTQEFLPLSAVGSADKLFTGNITLVNATSPGPGAG